MAETPEPMIDIQICDYSWDETPKEIKRVPLSCIHTYDFSANGASLIAVVSQEEIYFARADYEVDQKCQPSCVTATAIKEARFYPMRNWIPIQAVNGELP